MSSDNHDTRTRILEAAWKLLEKGPDARTRMSDIARAAGISRQGLYLHFPSRADLLIATTRYLDQVKNVDARLEAGTAASGEERLNAFIEAWGNYIPEIHGVARALMTMQETDAEARRAWGDRMQAMREGCEAAITALARDRRLATGFSKQSATDLLWALLSVGTWEQLVQDRGWSQRRYIDAMKTMACRSLVSPPV